MSDEALFQRMQEILERELTPEERRLMRLAGQLLRSERPSELTHGTPEKAKGEVA